ncbi:hypothetical protein FHX42_004902 [Saccharopolyspora lacisalsi]|uniref:Methyltransferase n=1 Tax=Halosaccharopolyspora lacisalsi TaxID=1000566 RepID=A0A839E4I7_9PSEU|nr:methyltransferase [Halosaccharopolyspora lacisalsi]MBA8827506.1 hypothetical protein [Halosaccharopolyspora lacisalsi]
MQQRDNPSSSGSPAGQLATSITGFIVTQAVYASAKLGIADLVNDGPVPIEELAKSTNTDSDSLYRLLRMLSGSGIFVEHADSEFGNSEVSSLLRSDLGTFRDFAITFGEGFYTAFGDMLRSVETGSPSFNMVHGTDYDSHYAQNPESGRHYHAFMAGGKRALAARLAAEEWQDGELVVDVGGGNGTLLIELLQRRPELRGLVTDLDHVVRDAEERIALAELGDRLTAVGGDFFGGVPSGGHSYLLSRILHGWSDRDAAVILHNVRRAIPEEGRLIIVNDVVAPPNEPGQKMMDLLALVLGGRERTESQWCTLLSANGFELTDVRPGSLHSLIDARPV